MNRPGTSLVILGWLGFIVSMFLPAIISVQDSLLGWQVVLRTSFSGWQAALLGVGALDDIRREPLQAVSTFAAALTNVVILATPWAVLRPQSRASRGLSVATVVAIFVNAAFAIVRDRSLTLGPGYFVWVSSFVVIAVGLYLSRGREIGQPSGVSLSRVA